MSFFNRSGIKNFLNARAEIMKRSQKSATKTVGNGVSPGMVKDVGGKLGEGTPVQVKARFAAVLASDLRGPRVEVEADGGRHSAGHHSVRPVGSQSL